MPQSFPSRRLVSAALAGGLGLALAATSVAPAQAREEHGPRGPLQQALSRMSLEEKVGQLFVQNVYVSDATTPDSRNIPLYGVASPAEVVKKYHLGGVIYFAWTDSAKNPQQITGLSNGLQQAARESGAHIPLLIGTDQEQGVVTRIGPPATQFPGSMALGAGRSTDDARTAAAITGQELKAMGITTDYAPDADVNVSPLNPVIGTRSFSSHTDLVAQMVTAQVKGYQEDGRISSTAKHFPGHGDTSTDSHTGLPVITHTREQWAELDEPPFRAAIAAGIDSIMTAHIVVPALDPAEDPATLSRPILTGILREELGYDGVVVTDSLGMEGVRTKYGDDRVPVLALKAGVDQLLNPPDLGVAWNAVLNAVRGGELTE